MITERQRHVVVRILAIVPLIVAFVLVDISVHNTIEPTGIVIHHSGIAASQALDEADLDEIHEDRGFSAYYWGKTWHVGYHYIILPDGTVQYGRPEHLIGAHTRGFNHYIGICLIGDFSAHAFGQSAAAPSDVQMESLLNLVRQLQQKYHIAKSKVFLHKELNSKTLCPGEGFPSERVRALLTE
jgi:N-acetylmuramoyl-L-alanine amidase